MALQTSGTITMNDIRTELGIPSQAPFGLDQARQGVYVPLNSCSTNKPPTSGAVSLASWYGYNHAATCSCAVTYTMNLPTSGNWSNGTGVTTIPIVLGSTGNVDITVNFTFRGESGSGFSSSGFVQFYVEYWNGSYWSLMGMYGSDPVYFRQFGSGITEVNLNLKAATYPGYNTIRVVGEIGGLVIPPNFNPIVYFASAPTVYVTCPALETCAGSGSNLTTHTFPYVENAVVRWIDLGGFVTGTVDVDWSFVREAGAVTNGFRMKIYYNGSEVADTGDIFSSSDTLQTGTLTFTVNGTDSKYAVLYYDPYGY